MKTRKIIISAILLLLLCIAVGASDGTVSIYKGVATNGIGAIWKTNSTQSWLRQFEYEDGGKGFIFSWYNNRNSSGDGLPEGETLKLYVPAVEIKKSDYKAATVEFRYGVYSGDGDVVIGKTGLSEVHVSTDGGATYSESFVPLAYHELTGEILTTSGEANGVAKECIVYKCVSGDLLSLVGDGKTITNIMIRPYGDSQNHTGALRIIDMEVKGFTGEYTPMVSVERKAPTMAFDGSKLRESAVAHANRLGEIEWTPKKDVTTNNYSATDETLTYHQYYKVGTTYYGPTYARPIPSSTELFKSAIDENNVYTGGITNETVYGMDCAQVVVDTISRVTPLVDVSFHAAVNNPGRMHEVGDIKIIPEDERDTLTAIQRYDKQTVFDAYSKMRPGDTVYANPRYLHVRVVTGTPMIVRNSKGEIDGSSSTVTMTETAGTVCYTIELKDGSRKYLMVYNVYDDDTKKETTTYAVQNTEYKANRSFRTEAELNKAYPDYKIISGSSIRVNKSFTFDELYETEYIGFTLDVYEKTEIELPDIQYITKTTSENFLDIGLTGIIQSNYKMYTVNIYITDRHGDVIYTKTLYPTWSRALTMTIASQTIDMKIFLRKLKMGTFNVKVTATTGPYLTTEEKGFTTTILDLPFKAGKNPELYFEHYDKMIGEHLFMKTLLANI